MRGSRRRFTPITLMTATAVFFACGESPTAPGTASATSGISESGTTADISNPVVLSVKGSGQVTAIGELPGYEGVEEWRTFSVNATKRANDTGNTASGHTQFNNRANGGTAQQMTVVCMRRVGPNVIIGTEVTHRISENTPQVPAGLPFAEATVGVDHGTVFLVQDNGQGAGADPDMITQMVNTTMFWVNLTCGGALDAQVPTLMAGFGVPVEAGNIQVRP